MRREERARTREKRIGIGVDAADLLAYMPSALNPSVESNCLRKGDLESGWALYRSAREKESAGLLILSCKVMQSAAVTLARLGSSCEIQGTKAAVSV